MLRGLWRLTWLELKIFVREPLGVFGTFLPALVVVVLQRVVGSRTGPVDPDVPRVLSVELPILGCLLITATAVMSLVAIIAIYRDGGILRRLRATPLRPQTILTAHVLVKLLFTTITLGVMMFAGGRYNSVDARVPLVSFAIAMLFSTMCILSLGFIIASLVPTARFAQPIGSLVIYPMIGLSGLFAPISTFPYGLQWLARLLPTTYVVSLLRGIWEGDGWLLHASDVLILTLMFLAFTALSAKVFRWE
jgi:ABC-2 type transport system permease protein